MRQRIATCLPAKSTTNASELQPAVPAHCSANKVHHCFSLQATTPLAQLCSTLSLPAVGPCKYCQRRSMRYLTLSSL